MSSGSRCLRGALAGAVLALAVLSGPAPASAATPAGWSQHSSPNPPGSDFGIFGGISCYATDGCTAVGQRKISAGGAIIPLVARWNGTTWALQTINSPAGATQSTAMSVSCLGANDCVAVGDYTTSAGLRLPLAERWNGTAWSAPQSVPLPATAQQGSLQSVSCTAANACTAVGRYFSASGAWPLAERWDGSHWTPQPTPAPAPSGEDALLSVSCQSASSCVAVGFHGHDFGTGQPLAEVWNGTTWSNDPLAIPPGMTTARLTSISCTAGFCAAVGYSLTRSTNAAALIEVFDGSSWARQPVPVPPSTSNEALNGVSCTTSDACTAVGDSFPSWKPVALRFNGQVWVPERVPPAAPEGLSYSVSCVSATWCASVGEHDAASGTRLTLFDRWGGPAWWTTPTGAPDAPKGAHLFGVSCANADWCMAVGQYINATGGLQAFEEYWDGAVWKLLPDLAEPPGGIGTALYSVSCPAVNSCMAVGSFGRTDNHLLPMAVRWNGSSWIRQTLALPSARIAELRGISCAASFAPCTAVGYQEQSLGAVTVPLAERYNVSWALQSPPVPPQAASAILNSVSCVPAGGCEAVGDWNNGHGNMPLAETLGSAWSINATSQPTGSTENALYGVSCSSAKSSVCMAAGFFDNSAGRELPLTEQLTGTSWGVIGAVTPGGASATDFEAIACPAANDCAAVGFAVGSSQTQALAEQWTGSGWIRQTTENPTPDQRFYGVDCGGLATCTAVGSQASTGTAAPMAENYS